MSRRLKDLSQNFVSDPVDYLDLWALIPADERKIIDKVHQFGKTHLTTQEFYCHVDKAEFPFYLVEKLKKVDIAKYFVPPPYGAKFSLVGQGVLLATLAEYDMGFATFLMLQAPLCGNTLNMLGSEQQKQKYLKELIGLQKIWGWALTQKNIGSNATQLQTKVTHTGDGFLLNGNKRWIGNGNRDYLIVYAKESVDTNAKQSKKPQVKGVIVDMKSKGITSVKIQNKLPLRIVQNCQITFDNVLIPSQSHLPNAYSYKSGVEVILRHSRIFVLWIAVGGCIGVYKNMIKHVKERTQFGREIASFQLVQQRVVRVLATLQAMILSCWHVTSQAQSQSQSSYITIAKISMFKAWVTLQARKICELGREVLGGDGVLHDRFIMRAMCDMEAIYTYQGTYDINSLVAGSEITGVRAFL